MAAQAVPTHDPEPLNWKSLAACGDTDPNIFFPSPGDTEGIAFAKSFCCGCRVKPECLAFAKLHEGRGDPNLDLGIYGGLTYDERRSMYRKSRVRRANA